MNSVITYQELMGLNKEENMESIADTATVDTTNVSTETPTATVDKTYPKNLVALNVLIRDGKAIVTAQGHSKNSFKRNYEIGTAVYTCKNCGATLSVSTTSDAGITGTVLENRCTITPTSIETVQ